MGPLGTRFGVTMPRSGSSGIGPELVRPARHGMWLQPAHGPPRADDTIAARNAGIERRLPPPLNPGSPTG